MDYRQENGFSVGNVVQVLGENSTENWGAIPATRVPESDKDYVMWNADSSINSNLTPNHEERSRSGSEPPNKRSRNSVSGDLIASNRAKAIGKMFYKTKLCCKFRAGTCPYVTNCNFAHSVEELRKPPPNWQEIVAAHEEERTEPREEFQIPILGVTDEPHRSHKGRHCKKFYTDEGCPYGDTCTFLHDEQSRARESVAISLGPGSGAGYGTGGSESTLKPSNWKTRICNKWELTGYCPFGSKCHFAHGSAELNRSGGGPSDPDFTDATASADAKQGSAAPINSVASSAASVPDLDGYRIGAASQPVMPKTGLPTAQKWNGPNKISKIYGDWIDDL